MQDTAGVDCCGGGGGGGGSVQVRNVLQISILFRKKLSQYADVKLFNLLINYALLL